MCFEGRAAPECACFEERSLLHSARVFEGRAVLQSARVVVLENVGNFRCETFKFVHVCSESHTIHAPL